ncbi:MAG: cell division protein ZapA [Tissierellia bacterium]|nr:cell division protein ZapA [Tissierellia bacterium]
MVNSNKIEVVIDGLKYTMVADANQDKTIKIADYVDNKIASMRDANPKLNHTMLYTLTLMNVTGEMFEMKEKYDALVEESKEPIQRFRTISEEVEKVTSEKEELVSSIEKLKDDLVTSLNTISDMNKRYTSLDKENKNNIETIKSKNKQMTELNENMTKMQEEMSFLQKQYQEILKRVNQIIDADK